MKFGNLRSKASNFLNQYKASDPATYAAAQQAVGGLLILDGFIGIDNPLGGKKRSGIFGSLIGIVVGVIFLFVPTFFGTISGTKQMTAMTSATVASVTHEQAATTTTNNGTQNTSQSCSAIAQYKVDGKDYSQQSAFSSSSICGLSQGSTIQISYNPTNPGSWGYDIKTLDHFLIIFALVGGIVILASLLTFAVRLLSIIFGWKVLQSGRALARTLPGGTNLETIVSEVKKDFAQHIFGFGNGGLGSFTQPASAAQSQPVWPQQPQQPQTVAPIQPVVPPQVVQPTSPNPVPPAPDDPNSPHLG
jgi:uncharacterized membrane protein